MDGTVTFFSQDKGYGFIKTQREDHFFHAREVRSGEILRTGDQVRFTAQPGPPGKSPRATTITLVARPQVSAAQTPRHTKPARAPHQDHREVCAHCGKKIVPRMTMRNNTPYKSFCPFCGAVHKNFQCFIATAVYGDTFSPEVVALRAFRDQRLMPNALGRAFVRTYYRLSPPIARLLATRPRLAAPVRTALNAFLHWYTH